MATEEVNEAVHSVLAMLPNIELKLTAIWFGLALFFLQWGTVAYSAGNLWLASYLQYWDIAYITDKRFYSTG